MTALESQQAVTATDQKQQQQIKSATYPHYLVLSNRLQALSSTRNDTKDKSDEIEDPATDSTTKDTSQQSSNEWDLSTDALLATLLHEVSQHIQSRTHHVSSEIRALQNSVNQVGVEVGLVQQKWMKKSHDICMEQVVGDDVDDSDSDSEEGMDVAGRNKLSAQQDEEEDDDDDSSADIARLEAEEKDAIQNGMKALSLFFDPKRPKCKKKSNDDDVNDDEDDISDEDHHDNIVISTEEDNMIGDNCYFYPAAEADGFNQRPLPFIVGSREFMESSCSVGGGEVIEED